MNMDASSANNNNRLSSLPFLITLALLLILAVFINQNLKPITSKPASAPKSEFSGERANNILQDLLKEQLPHPVDSRANRVIESRIIERLRAMGYQEEIQDTQECRDYEMGVARCTRVRNIIVTIEGTQHIPDLEPALSDRNGILLAAHYDSVGAGEGANDAGVAVVTLLEIARLLTLEPQPRNDIVLLFNEGEEFGLFGAKAFMNQHPLAKKLKLAINIEARGSDGQSVMFETGENSGWLVEEYAATTPAPLSSSLFYEVYKVLPNDTDLTVFKEHNLQGLNFAHGGNEPHYHTPLDNLSNIQAGTIQHHGDNAWGVLKNIKDKDFSQLNETNIVYTDILGQFVIKWQQSTSIVISVIAFLLMILVAWTMVKQGELHGKSIRKGVYTFFTIFILLTIAGLAVQKMVQLTSDGTAPWRVNNFPMQITLWSALALIGFYLSRWFTKQASPINVLLGLVICWITLALVTSFLVVGISFLFIIPSIITLIAMLIIPFFKSQLADKQIPITLIIASLSVAIMFMPIVYILEQMVGYAMSPAIGLMFSFVISGIAPLLAVKNSAKATTSKVNYAILALFVVGVVWTSAQPAHTAFIPQPINLIHVQQNDGESVLIAGTAANPPSQGLAEATKGIQASLVVPWSSTKSFNQKVVSEQLAPSAITIISNEMVEQQKVVNLQIESSGDNFRDLYLYAKKDTKLRSISYGETKLSYFDEKAFRNGYYEFHCRGLSCQSVELQMVFDSTGSADLLVVTSLSGLPKSNQNFIESRGDTAVQRQFGDQTLIIKKLTIQ